jgi:hypothetical protein
MERKSKNIKISEKHHEILKDHCDKSGLKIYRVIEKYIDTLNRSRKTDIYGEK